MDRTEQKSIIEGLLFVSGDEGISPEQIAKVLEIEGNEVIDILEEMQKECEGAHRGLQIVQYAKVYRFATKKEHASYYQKLIDIPTAASLSQAALETLAIVAYRQPITRTEMEEIRGVKTDKALQTLVSHLLIKRNGKSRRTWASDFIWNDERIFRHIWIKNIR